MRKHLQNVLGVFSKEMPFIAGPLRAKDTPTKRPLEQLPNCSDRGLVVNNWSAVAEVYETDSICQPPNAERMVQPKQVRS